MTENIPVTEAAQALGRIGGLKKSKRKTETCRANAKRPRPRRKKKDSSNAKENSAV